MELAYRAYNAERFVLILAVDVDDGGGGGRRENAVRLIVVAAVVLLLVPRQAAPVSDKGC